MNAVSNRCQALAQDQRGSLEALIHSCSGLDRIRVRNVVEHLVHF